MFNTISNNQTIAANQPEYSTNLKNALNVSVKNILCRLRFFTLAAVAVLTIIAANTNSANAANGCGSKGLSSRVPEYVFHLACNTHDIGYGTPYFKYNFTYGGWKDHIDSQFYENLKNACDRHYSDWYSNKPCKAAAWTYFQGVNRFGQAAYNNAQNRINSQLRVQRDRNGYSWTQYDNN